jgi:hypothetical protein
MSVLVVPNVDAIRQVIFPHSMSMERNKNEVKYGGKARPRLKTKAPERRVFGAGATRYRRWLALGPFGGATPIIETKNGALMPWFRDTFSLLVRCGFRVTVSG